MSLVAYIMIVIAAFVFMEGVAWFTHKYIMHGFLWYLHQDHHQPHEGLVEKNDLFFLIFRCSRLVMYHAGMAGAELVCCKYWLRHNLIWIGLFFGSRDHHSSTA
jgi:hypothetical protein